MAFILNPYDADLNLNNKDDRKFFIEGYKRLHEKDKFDGKKARLNDWMKLMGKELDDVRVMESVLVRQTPETHARTVGCEPFAPSDASSRTCEKTAPCCPLNTVDTTSRPRVDPTVPLLTCVLR